MIVSQILISTINISYILLDLIKFHTWKCNSLEIEKEMKRIADNIFGYNPKTDPRDPLFRKTLSWSVKKEGKGKKNEKND